MQRQPLTKEQPKFSVGDSVWYDPGGSRPKEGPYLINSVKLNGRYSLCNDDVDNTPVDDANDVEETQLKKAPR